MKNWKTEQDRKTKCVNIFLTIVGCTWHLEYFILDVNCTNKLFTNNSYLNV